MLKKNPMLPRKDETKTLMNHVQAGNCTFIFGMPFIGKTVLAHDILETLKAKDEMLPIYIDLKDFQGESSDTVLNSIILKIGEAVPGVNGHPIPEKGDREYHLKKLLKNLPGKKTVILLDSAEGIKKLSDWDIFFPTIRVLHVESRVVFFLFSRILPQGFAKDAICSPAVNIFEANLIKLNLLPKHVVDTLPQYLASSGIEVEAVFPGFIWKHTGGHPFSIRTYMDIYGTEKKKYPFLDERDFNGIEKKAEAALQAFYKQLFGMLRPKYHQIIAHDVLEGKISKNRDKFLRYLYELGILRQSDGEYQIFSIGARKYFQKEFKKKTGKIRVTRGKKEQAAKKFETTGMSNFMTGEEHVNSVVKILILAANPKATPRLRLDEEVREIAEGLKRAKRRDRFIIHQRWAVRLRDLRRALLDVEPQIVHFTGHGSEDGLLVEDESGKSVYIPPEALSGLFEMCAAHVECVILGACYTGSQAAVIGKHIRYVIGIPGEIKDKAAIEFSVGFYDALGAGKSVEQAFKFGCNAIRQIFPDLTEHLIPLLKKGPKA